MAISTLSLAKKIKATILRHPVLVERDGTQSVPESFKFNFGGELNEASTRCRNDILIILNALLDDVCVAFTTSTAADTDKNKTIALFAMRALMTLAKSPKSFLATTFQTRTYGAGECTELCARNGGEDAVSNLTNKSVSTFQFRRHTTDDNEWVYSWILIVDGISVSRGAVQPVHKMVTSLIKAIKFSGTDSTIINNAVAGLAKMKSTGDSYYWYLSDENTADYYKAFSKYLSLSSCMSKDNSYYNYTGSGQHPMQAYDASPDWSLMFISKMSPAKIIDMCNLFIANPIEESLFKFPFLSRCMVLPTSKEISGKGMNATPYVMGKFYGKDALVRYFYDDNKREPYVKNNNPLLTGSFFIEGGRIKAIPSTGETGMYLLPYFDKANSASFITDPDGSTWWESRGENKEDSPTPSAKCAYDKGVAVWLSYFSPGYNRSISIDGYRLNTFDTLFGEDVEEARGKYVECNIAGTSTMVPSYMTTKIRNERYLLGQTTTLHNGDLVATVDVINNPDYFGRIADVGIFDLRDDASKGVYDRIMQRTQETANA